MGTYWGQNVTANWSSSRFSTNSDISQPQRLAKQAAQANPDAWLEQSESVLATLFDCEDSTPFRVPVDLEKYPVSVCVCACVFNC